ncbi:MAG TPA: sigma-54 dependent transcriptional regulator [Verrucomicrobiae bacterium]|nr:sigma-54 dependent transcriptional regulator [Verrucomicrobiae bacterium]
MRGDMDKLLVVDDEADIRRAFQRNLTSETLQVVEAGNGEEAIRMVAKERPNLVVMDIRMGGTSGLDVLRKLRELDPKLLIIMMTAFGTTQTAIEAMKLGAYDYVLKPLEVPKLKALIESALKAARDMREVVSYQPLLGSEDHAEGIVGKSDAMQQVFKLIGQVSQSEATVLITGESGTGKELVARAIYHHSLRADKPFMAINCAAIPENLLESELFGHEKGAFTGAADRRIGKFEQCDHGTIFLDEIGDMPLATQTKILRVLQNGEFQRVGGNQTFHCDVRVIAATNRAPEQLVSAKKFREDLYYRLNVVRIHLPPLRERKEDVRLLVHYFLQRLVKSGTGGGRVTKISSEALKILERSPWPGNVRELENVIERSAVVARGDSILPKDLPSEVREMRTAAVPAEDLVAAIDAAVRPLYALAKKDRSLKIMALVERELITRALTETNGNQVQAAKLLGITRATLRKRIEKFGIAKRLEVT